MAGTLETPLVEASIHGYSYGYYNCILYTPTCLVSSKTHVTERFDLAMYAWDRRDYLTPLQPTFHNPTLLGVISPQSTIVNFTWYTAGLIQICYRF